MTVIVQGTEPEPTKYQTATDWHIDEEGRLHVRDANKKHIAAYNHNAWASAHTEEANVRTVTVRLEADTSDFEEKMKKANQIVAKSGLRRNV